MITSYFCTPNFISWRFFIRDVLNIIDANIAAEKYSRMYINLFIFRIYNMD
jgi:hypothetical protein